MNTISVIDLGIGNIGSVIRMIEKLGGVTEVISTPDELLSAKKLILPGVGSFDAGMAQIKQLSLQDNILKVVRENKIPILGICLGMQLLCRRSEEGKSLGLGLIDADVKKFSFQPSQMLKIPHMGWNTLTICRNNLLMKKSEDEKRFYFVHSYYVQPDDEKIIVAASNHGGEFCAVFQDGNIFGVQFHPEKSHRFGLDLFNNFLSL